MSLSHSQIIKEKKKDEQKNLEQQQEQLNRSLNLNAHPQPEGTESEQDRLVRQIEGNMPAPLQRADAAGLIAQAPLVESRMEVDLNMPVAHRKLSELEETLNSHKKFFGDSSEMAAVKKDTKDLVTKLSLRTVSPTNDTEFESNLKEILAGYERMMASCRAYVYHAGKPSTKKGEKRLDIVKDILLQAQAEAGRIAYSARQLRSNAIAQNDDGDITFDELMEHMQAKDAQAETGLLYRVNDASRALLAQSRFAEAIGMGAAMQKAEYAAYRKADGTCKDYVRVDADAADMKKLEELVSDNGGVQPELSEQAAKQMQMIRLFDLLLGKEARSQSGYLCRYSMTGEGENAHIRIESVQATMTALGVRKTKDVEQDVKALFAIWKDKPACMDKEVINRLLTINSGTFAAGLKDVLDKGGCQVIEERLAMVKKALAEAGLTGEDGVYRYKSEKNIVISELTKEERQQLRIDTRLTAEKNRIKTAVDNARQRLGERDESDPFSRLLSDLDRYADMKVTAVTALTKASGDTAAGEAKLLGDILKQAASLRAQLANDAEALALLNELMTPIEKAANGSLEAGFDMENEYLIDQSDPSMEPMPNVSNTAQYKDMTDVPLFSHTPCANDIRQGKIGNCFFMVAAGALANANPQAIRDMMRDNGDGTVTVRLFQFVNKQFSPVYVKVRKSIPVKSDGSALFAEDCLWVNLLGKAYVCSGITYDVRKIINRQMQDEKNLENHDYTDDTFAGVVGDLKAFPSDKERQTTGSQQERGIFQTLVGGYTEDVLAVFTGKGYKNLEMDTPLMYWGDFRYDKFSENAKHHVDTKAKYASFDRLSDEGKDYLYELMEQNDEKLIDKAKQKKQALEGQDLGESKKKKKVKIPKKRAKTESAASNVERDAARYFMYTGKKLQPDLSDKEAKKEMAQVRNANYFVMDFLEFMDDYAPLSKKDAKPGELFAKAIKDFAGDAFINKGNTKQEKDERRAFLASEDFKSVRRWLRETLKKTPWDDSQGRYTHYSSNYYGKALDVFEQVKAGQTGGKVMSANGSPRLSSSSNAGGANLTETEMAGLFGNHAYAVHGAVEREFGGKTYKFIVMRNPWGDNGTEYYYDTKAGALNRRAAKPELTEGFTLVELSDFMMLFSDLYVEK